MKIKKGMKIRVFSPDGTEDWGDGVIRKIDELRCEGEILSKNYPSEILLDSGKIVEGLTCWWYPKKGGGGGDK